MNNRREDFTFVMISEIAKYIKNKIQKILSDIRVALFLTFLILLFDQAIIACQKPNILVASSVDSARKTGSYIGSCKAGKIELIDGYVLPKNLNLENHHFYLISRYEEKRLLLSWYYYENTDKKYLCYDEFSIYDEFKPYFEGQPYIKLKSETEELRKTIPSNSRLRLEIEDYEIGDSIKIDIVESFWKNKPTKTIGKITLVCDCDKDKINLSSNYHK